MSRFKLIRNSLKLELKFYREYGIEDVFDVYTLKNLLLNILDIYQAQYGGVTMLQDELLFLTDYVYDFIDIVGIGYYCNDMDLSYDEIYEVTTRTLILIETIDDRAPKVLKQGE